MSKIVQIYSDKERKIKAYPKTLADSVYMDDGVTSVKEHVRNKINFLEDASSNVDVPEVIEVLKDINGKYDATKGDIQKVTEQLETIETKKADKTETSNLQGQINNLVVNGTGDSNPEVVQARGEEILLNDRLNKTDYKNDTILQYKTKAGKNLLDTTIYENLPISSFNATTIINLKDNVALSNNTNYRVVMFFTDGTQQNDNNTSVQFRNNDTKIFEMPLGNWNKTTTNAETVNNIRIYLNPTAINNNDGKTISYIMLSTSSDVTYERYTPTFSSIRVDEMENNVNSIDVAVKSIIKDGINLFDKNKITNDTWIYNGGFATNGGYFITDYIPCDYSTIIYTNLTTTRNAIFYDSNFNKLTPIQFTKAFFVGSDSRLMNAKYIIFDCQKANIDTLIVQTTPIIKNTTNKVLPLKNLEYSNNNMINWWEGKVGDSLGDSLTEQRYFQLYTTYYLNLTKFYCHGVGGSKLSGTDANAMWQDVRINALNPNADFITILGGQNDGSVTIGEITKTNMNTNTYVGAYNTIIDKIYKKYNGKIQIILCTPFYVPSEGDDGLRFHGLGEAVREIGKLHGLPVADFGGLSGANKYVKDIYWGTDKVHPLESFYRDKITPILVDTLNKVRPIDYNKCNYMPLPTIDQN